MRDEDVRADSLFVAVSRLPLYDVDDVRARRLRNRCRATLTAETAPAAARGDRSGSTLRSAVGVTLMALWSAMYFAAALRQAAAIYRP